MSIGAGSDLPPLVALVQADVADFLAKVQVVSGQLDSLSSKDTQTTIGANIADFESKMAAVNEALAEWGSAEGTADARLAIDEAMASFAAVEAELDKWGASHATATADVDITAALAKLTALHALAGSGGAGGGGTISGLLGGAAAGGGRAGVDTGGLLSRLLWGGGSAFGLAGFGSLGSLAGFGPEHLATVGLGLAGSATGGLIGGGLLAAGSLGTAAVGMGTDLAGIGQAAGDTKATYTNLNALSAAQAEYGKNSAQAAAAQTTLNQQLAGFNSIAKDAVVQTAETAQGFVKMFDSATGAAEKTGAEILTQAIHVGEEFLPTIGKFAAENTSIIQKDIQPLFSWMGGQGLQIFTDLENKFQGELPTSLNALTQGIELFARTIDLASQSTGGLMQHLSDFLTRMNGGDWSTWSGYVEKLIGDFRLWDDFVKILFKDIADLFSKDVGTAAGIVQTLTNALDSLHTWINSTTGSAQLQTIFEVHKQQILDLLPVVGRLIDSYGTLFLKIAPDAVRITDDLITALGDVLTIIEKTGPLGDYALAIALIATKLGLLSPILKAVFGKDVFEGFIAAADQAIGKVTTLGATSTATAEKVAASDTAMEGTNAAATASFAEVAGTEGIGSIATAATATEATAKAAIGGIATAVSGLATLALVPIVFTVVFKETLQQLNNQATQNADFSATGAAIANLNTPSTQAFLKSHPGWTVNPTTGQWTNNNTYNGTYTPPTPGMYEPQQDTAPAGSLTVTHLDANGKVIPAIPTGNVTPPTGPTTASQAAAAQVPAAVTKGMSELSRLVADVHSTSLATLRSAVVQVHEKGFSDLISQLDAIHSTASLKLASQLENVAKEAGKNQTAEVKTIESAEAAARVAATVQAETAMTQAAEKQASDAAAAYAQLASDASKLKSDTSSGQVTGMADYATILTDQGNAQIQAIQDGAQIAADQLAETGLTGAALAAAQAQVALDVQKQTDDARINADTIALAQQKATDDAAIAAATQHADQVAQLNDQAVALAQQTEDTYAINDQSRVNTDNIIYQSDLQSQNQKLIKDSLAQLTKDTDTQSNDQNYYGGLLVDAQNTQTRQNSDAQGALQQIVNSSQLLEQALQDILSGDTTAAGIAEAKLEAIVGGLTSVASATTAAATTPAATAPIQVTVVTQIDGQQVALTTTPLIRQELLRSTARQTQNVLGGSAGRLTPSR